MVWVGSVHGVGVHGVFNSAWCGRVVWNVCMVWMCSVKCVHGELCAWCGWVVWSVCMVCCVHGVGG